MEKGAEQVAARRAADQEYHRRCRSDAAAWSTKNRKLETTSSTKQSTFSYEVALIDVSVDITPNITIMLPCWRCPVVRPHRRAAAVRSAAAVCYKRIASDWAGTRYTICCSFRTAPTAFTWTSRDGEAKSVTATEYYCCWRLMQRDGRAWTSCCVATGCSRRTL